MKYSITAGFLLVLFFSILSYAADPQQDVEPMSGMHMRQGMGMMNNMSEEQNEIKKVIIPVAGLGTRFLPLSRAISKDFWPLVDKPVIQYIIEEVKKSGIKEKSNSSNS